MLANTCENEWSLYGLNIVDHLNFGSPKMNDDEEKKQLV